MQIGVSIFARHPNLPPSDVSAALQIHDHVTEVMIGETPEWGYAEADDSSWSHGFETDRSSLDRALADLLVRLEERQHALRGLVQSGWTFKVSVLVVLLGPEGLDLTLDPATTRIAASLSLPIVISVEAHHPR